MRSTWGGRPLRAWAKKRWRRLVADVVERYKVAADYIVLGGGNAKKVGALPPGARLRRQRQCLRRRVSALGGDRLTDRNSPGHKGTAGYSGPPQAYLGPGSADSPP